MKRLLSLFLVVILLLTMFSGCSKGKTFSFVFFVNNIPTSVDPQLAFTNAEITAVINSFSGLFRTNQDGIPQQECIENYEISNDELTYTFYLKDNIYYNKALDEKENEYYIEDDTAKRIKVTSHDFVFAFQRVFDSQTRSPYNTAFQAIKNSSKVLDNTLSKNSLGVKAIDDTTLQITLEYKDPEFISKLTLPGAMPCNQQFFENCQGSYGLKGTNGLTQNLMFNGDFAITVWNDTDGITLRRTNSASKQINRIRLVTNQGMYENKPDDQDMPITYPTAQQRLEQGISNGELLHYTSDVKTNNKVFSLTTWSIVFNCNDKYFSNANIRNALAESYKFSHIQNNNNILSKASGIIPPSVTVVDKSFRDYSKLLPTASSNGALLYKEGTNELYEQNIVRDNRTLEDVTVLVPDTPEIQNIANQMFQIWQRDLGAFFKIEVLPQEQLIAKVQSGNYQLAFYPFIADTNDCYSLLSKFTTDNPQNVCNFSDSHYDSLVENTLSAQSAYQRATRYADAEMYLVQQSAIAPLWYDFYYFETYQVDNIVLNPFGPTVDLKWAVFKD